MQVEQDGTRVGEQSGKIDAKQTQADQEACDVEFVEADGFVFRSVDVDELERAEQDQGQVRHDRGTYVCQATSQLRPFAVPGLFRDL